ncbi:hypothetical protein MY5147_008958 [Beauveria neobassiana]
MAHNKNARAAAQLLASRHCRVHAATGGPTISATKTAATMYSEPSRRTRSSANPGSSLWNMGIDFEFAPKAEAEAEAPSLYPTLDFKRFFHSQEAAAGASDNGLLNNKASQPLQLPKAPVTATVKPDWGNQPIPSTTFTTTVVVEKATTGTSTACTEPAAQPPDTSSKDAPSTIEPPLTSLDFNISKDLFKAALGQPKDSAGSFWSHTMYKSTSADGTVQDVQVHYCTSRQAMEVACQTYFAHEPVLGFDLEWVAYATRGGGPRQNVSLIQLASPGRIGLFHVALFPKADEENDGGLVAPTFRAIMEDAAVDKVGVHIQADCTRLRNFLGVDARGVFELSHLYKLVKHAGDKQRRKLINKVPVALATQVQEILKLPLFKGESVRGSNWSKPLTLKQLTYSAADAYAGLQLYHVLEERRLAMDPPPDRPRHAELRLPIPIPPTPVVSDVESDVDSDLESVKDSSSEFSDDSIEETMLELAMAESSLIAESSSIAARPSPSAATATAAAAVTAAAQTQTQTPTRDARIVAAEAEMARLQASRARGRLLARPSALRTFYLWQANDDLAPADVARLLREPPLQTGTVIGYILDAIKAEKLAFPKERLRREVLSILHPTLAGGKYRAVVERCGQDET